MILRNSNFTKKRQKGFSLIELVVVITIFGIMTSVSMFNYSEHRRSLQSTDLAQDLALTIRQAQVYGISASGGNIGSESFDPNMLFGGENPVDITQDRSMRGVSIFLKENKIILFEDINRDAVYNDGSDRIIDERNIIYKNTSFLKFTLSGEYSEIEKDKGRVDIVFERPYPDAIINYFNDITSTSGTPYTNVSIFIGSLDYEKPLKSVSINSIGNIVVK